MPFYVGDFMRDTAHLGPAERGVYLSLIMHYWIKGGPITQNLTQLARICGCVTADELEIVKAVLDEFFKPDPDGWRHKRIDAELLKSAKKAEAARENGQKGGRPKTQEKPRENPEVNPTKTQPITQEETQTKPSAKATTTTTTSTVNTNKAYIHNTNFLESAEASSSESVILQSEKESSEVQPTLKLVTEANEPKKKVKYPESFENFWKLYPKKVGKTEAFNIWKSKKLDAIEKKLIQGLENQLKAYSDKEKQFWKDPERWLKYERWNDELTATGNVQAITSKPPSRIQAVLRAIQNGGRVKTPYSTEVYDAKALVWDNPDLSKAEARPNSYTARAPDGNTYTLSQLTAVD